MKKLTILIIATIFSLQLSAQNYYYSFKDKDTKLKGMKEASTGEIVIPAEYDKILDWNNETVIVMKGNEKMAINYLNEIIVSPTEQDLYLERYDPVHFDEVFAYNNDVYIAENYKVNSKGQCIPIDYYPCPTNFNIDTTNASAEHKLIQKSVEALRACEAEEAIKYAQKAIDANPNNAASRYWYSRMFIEQLCGRITNEVTEKHKSEIETHINKAIELETEPFYLTLTYAVKYDFEKNHNKNKAEKKIAYQNLKEFNAQKDKVGIMLQFAGNYYFNDYSVEASLGLGITERTLGYFDYMSYGYFLTYEHFFQDRIDAFKYSNIFSSPYFTSGLDLGMMTDYERRAFVIKPEVGLNYHGLKLMYGYNFVNKTKFPNQRGHVISLKFEFMTWGTTWFSPTSDFF